MTPLLALLTLACSDDIDPTEDDTATVEDPIVDVQWAPCSLVEGEDDGLAECATTALPLFRDDPDDDRTIDIAAKRLRAGDDPVAQLWLLDGGPGSSGVIRLPGLMARFAEWFPGVEVLTIDHRGTGYSERMGCPAELRNSPGGTSILNEEMDACIADFQDTLGDRPDAYGTTASAQDVIDLIRGSRIDGVPVYVWGGSYGTYWAQRVLLLAPELLDGVVIEGIFPADGTMIYAEANTDAAAHALFDLCAEDTLCRERLGEDPWGRLREVYAMVDAGHCTSQGLSSDVVSIIFAYLMYSRAGMSVIPAATARLERCAPADETALVHLYTALFGSGGAFDIDSYSMLLQHHVVSSEMWTHPDFDGVDLYGYYDDLYAEALVAKQYGYTRADLAARWPAYSDPAHDDVFPETDTPVLMLQGALDPVTAEVWARDLADHLDGPNQHYVVFPSSAHNVSGDSPTADGTLCGGQIMAAFLEDPTATPDTSCVAETLPVDFDPPSAYADYWFGTTDAWD
ncbi:MAG: alpha/beta fold hydrolase [Alphaproteobacteria bacterium]|nr:alpha/beta fold hydrolase [Alphaproteobacteria bacterium]